MSQSRSQDDGSHVLKGRGRCTVVREVGVTIPGMRGIVVQGEGTRGHGPGHGTTSSGRSGDQPVLTLKKYPNDPCYHNKKSNGSKAKKD